MAFLAALFLCCSSQDRRSSKLEGESRTARRVAVSNDAHHHPRAHRYLDAPPAYADISQQPLIPIDEKKSMDFELVVEDEDDTPGSTSSRSSIISIPSTRLTDLTSNYTGETIPAALRGGLERASTRGSRPPSYHSNPRRSPSPASLTGVGAAGERDSGAWEHPVLANDWLDLLRQDALREAATRRRSGEQDGNTVRGARPG